MHVRARAALARATATLQRDWLTETDKNKIKLSHSAESSFVYLACERGRAGGASES
jgi:hypothetical protein